MDPLPTINKVFSMVVQEERQREITFFFDMSAQEGGGGIRTSDLRFKGKI
jgi:hypothetical protein